MILSSSKKVVLRAARRREIGLSSIANFRIQARCNSSASEEHRSLEKPSPVKRASSSKRIKTIKEYNALPNRLISNNGTAANPLPAWDGGLDSFSDEKSQDALDVLSPVPRRRRKTAATEIISEDPLDPEAIKSEPKKRGRKPRSPAVNIDQTPGVVETNQVVAYTTVIRRSPRNQLAKEILENLTKFPHCILLTRVGQFYESYFDQAQEVSRLLSIKLTKRTWDDQRIWMCGFPIMHLDKYLKILVQQHGRSVAMCEEFRKPREAGEGILSKPSFERRVVRVLTPGTLIDESFVNPYENNFLLAISADEAVDVPSNVGMAWIDVSTGEFFTRSTPLETLKDHIVRISPREIVFDRQIENDLEHPIRTALLEESCPVSFTDGSVDCLNNAIANTTEVIDDVVTQLPLDEPSSVFSTAETLAIGVLNSFLQSNLLEHAPRTLRPLREEKSQRMQIDAHTLKALEIRESIREGGTSGSLMSSIRRTVTSSGTRLLARWLCSPSTCLEEIIARQKLVELFKTRTSLRTDLIELLKGAEDATRISQKFLLGKGGIDDLVSLCSTISIWESIKGRILLEKEFEQNENGSLFASEEWYGLDQLMSRMIDLTSLARRIELAIDSRDNEEKQGASEENEGSETEEEEPITTLETSRFSSLPGADTKWTIKPQFSAELESLHDQLNQLQHERERMQKKYQEQYCAPSLTLRHSPSHGLHVHIGRPRRDSERLNISRQFMQLAESKSTRTYFNQEWFVLGNAILETTSGIYNAEREAFLTLRSETNAEAISIRKNARSLDELDVTSAFANLASEMNFVRPVISNSSSFHIENGRHPTVELGLLEAGRMFTPNTVSMSESSRLHIITGPNMAGKSTYLRQTALIAILAQTGSFVPADSAHIGIVDKVFSRIGAKDDLFRDRSTFMVEMLESAEILKNATDKSLVIMDEVGRGTTVKDGLAIAFATVHHLYFVNKSRALFATHFHELVDMLGFSEDTQNSDAFPDLEFFCTDLEETDGEHFTYSHRMRPGVNRNSHGLKVAQLAGMPQFAVSVAKEALSSIHAQETHTTNESTELDLKNIGRRLASIKTFSDIQ